MPKVRYLHLVDGRLEKVTQRRVFDAWEMRKRWADMRGDREDRLVEAVFDDVDRLVRVDFLRFTVRHGWITTESRSLAMRARMLDRDGPEAAYHLEGWPSDIRLQLMVALDSVVAGVRFGAGGMLALSEQLGTPVCQLLRQHARTINRLWADRPASRLTGSDWGGRRTSPADGR